MIQIHSIKSRCGSQSETENYHHVVENHVVEIHVSQGIAVWDVHKYKYVRGFFSKRLKKLGKKGGLKTLPCWVLAR